MWQRAAIGIVVVSVGLAVATQAIVDIKNSVFSKPQSDQVAEKIKQIAPPENPGVPKPTRYLAELWKTASKVKK